MNQGQDQKTGFEERLLAQLRLVVSDRAAHSASPAPATGTGYGDSRARRLAPRLAVGGVGVAAAAAAVLAIGSGTSDTSSAFAVEPQGEGEVRVEISSLEDAQGLEKALGENGIKADVDYLAAGMACREPRFEASGGGAAKGKTTVGIKQTPDGAVFSINRDAVPAGDTLLVTASPGPEGIGDMVGVQVAEGAVSACDPVPAPEPPAGAVTQSNGAPGEGPVQSGAGEGGLSKGGEIEEAAPQKGLSQSGD